MEISGKIIVALPAQGGVSKAGKEWSRQDYVIETKEQYPKKIAFSVMNDNIMNFGLTVGQEVDIHIDINGWRKVNCVMRCFSFKLIGRGSASAKGVHQHSRRA